MSTRTISFIEIVQTWSENSFKRVVMPLIRTRFNRNGNYCAKFCNDFLLDIDNLNKTSETISKILDDWCAEVGCIDADVVCMRLTLDNLLSDATMVESTLNSIKFMQQMVVGTKYSFLKHYESNSQLVGSSSIVLL